MQHRISKEQQCENKIRCQISSVNCSLESLPNELLLSIVSYLTLHDVVQAFHGLNQRFNLLSLESARYVCLSKTISLDRLVEHAPDIVNGINTIRCNMESLPVVRKYAHLFHNIHFIVLRSKYHFVIKLNVSCDSIINTIESCLNVFRRCNMLKTNKNGTVAKPITAKEMVRQNR